MTIQVFTTVVNRPNFVEIQQKLFQKFLKDEYQFHVVDDSVDEDISKQFKSLCLNNDIIYYKKPSITVPMNPAQSCAAAVQWTYDNIIVKKYSEDIVFFCDSDMFLLEEFNIAEYMKDTVISGLPQTREHVKYMWNGIMFFDMKKIFQIDPDLDFSDGIVEGVLTDVGGHMYLYFKKNNVIMKETDVQYPTHFNDIELQDSDITAGYNFELHLDGKFLHYRAATNWHSNWKGSYDPLENKTKIFNKIIGEILNA